MYIFSSHKSTLEFVLENRRAFSCSALSFAEHPTKYIHIFSSVLFNEIIVEERVLCRALYVEERVLLVLLPAEQGGEHFLQSTPQCFALLCRGVLCPLQRKEHSREKRVLFPLERVLSKGKSTFLKSTEYRVKSKEYLSSRENALQRRGCYYLSIGNRGATSAERRAL